MYSGIQLVELAKINKKLTGILPQCPQAVPLKNSMMDAIPERAFEFFWGFRVFFSRLLRGTTCRDVMAAGNGNARLNSVLLPFNSTFLQNAPYDQVIHDVAAYRILPVIFLLRQSWLSRARRCYSSRSVIDLCLLRCNSKFNSLCLL